MKGLTKFAVKVGGKPIALLALILSCITIIIGLYIQTQQSEDYYQKTTSEAQQHTAKIMAAAVSSHVQAMMLQVTDTAKLPQVVSALSIQSESLIEQQQTQLSAFFPHASKVCLILAEVDKVDQNACLPITFATLNSLRIAKEKGSAPIGILGVASDESYILLAHRVEGDNQQVLGVLLVSLKTEVAEQLLLEEFGLHGYVELQQGTKLAAKVMSKGDVQWKKGAASYSAAIPNSFWRVAYWPEVKASSNLSIVLLASLLIAVALFWSVREFWLRLMLQQDTETLRQQLVDLQKGMLKPKYTMAFSLLIVIDDVQTMGREHTQSKLKKKAGAKARVGKQSVESTESTESTMPVEQEPEELSLDASIFRGYDIRGIVGDNIDEEVFRVIGQAIGSEAKEQKKLRLVVGRDGRLSSANLTKALIDGIVASGCSVIDIGQVPTPLLYFACEELGTQSGIMVTGSHNPANYNGLKIVLAGKTLTNSDINGLYQRIEQGNFSSGQGSVSQADVVDDYIKRIVDDVKTTRPVKVVIDCGNGIAGAVAPKLLREFGCEVIELYCDVDGTFPNHHPNPSQVENLEDLAAAVQLHEAELGLAFDGDGDRIGVIDANGQPIWPDRLMVMFAQDVLSREAEATVIFDVKCTNLLADAISRAGGEGIMSPSGYSIIKNKVQETGAKLAGEMSGHIFFNDRWFGFDDGLYAACRLLEFVSNDPLERTPTEVFAALPYRESTPEIFIDMEQSDSKLFVAQLVAESDFPGAEKITIDGVRADYPNGWGLVRASNTMPGLTLRFEGNSPDELEQIKQQFKQQMLQIKPSMTLSF